VQGLVTGIPLKVPKDVVTFETTIKISGPMQTKTGLPTAP